MSNMFEAATISQGGRFLCVAITPRMIEQAKARRTRLEQHTRHRSSHLDLGDRWLGDLGELVLGQYLKHHKIPFTWMAGPIDDQFDDDFEIVGWITEVKCQRTHYIPRKHFSLNIKESSFHHMNKEGKVHHIVWLIFHQEEMTMYLAGYMGRSMFTRVSRREVKGRSYYGNECKWDRRVVSVKETAAILKWMVLNEYQIEWRKHEKEKET